MKLLNIKKKYQFSSLFDLNKLKLNSQPVIDPQINQKTYDVAIIGGGSGGISMAYEAKKLGLNTIVFDYVEPSTQGTTWGLGGTCVNVGCIPKKLFHTAGILNEQFELAEGYGFSYENKQFQWLKLVNAVQQYIKSNNFGYKSELQKQGIPYVNALASIKNNNTLVFSPEKQQINNFLQENDYLDDQKLGQISFKNCIIATGGRPALLDDSICKNMKKYAITSDDIFQQKKEPKKTLVVGGGYIGLECGGFLKSLGYDVTLMTRGEYLRTMDRQSVGEIMDYMTNIQKINIIPTALPTLIEKQGDQDFQVTWQNQVDKSIVGTENYNTIIAAVSRNPNVNNLNLQNVGVNQSQKTQKIIGNYKNELEQTSVDNIYAIGDVLEGIPELTPVAQKSGILLARRLAQKEKLTSSKKTIYFDETVPSAVFTPNEYGFVGFSEEDAIKKYGEENLEIYLSKSSPLEESLSIKQDENYSILKKKTFFKIICLPKENEKIVGIHYVGPNAGEIIQGLAVAFKMGMTKEDLDNTIGIHPTVAESFVDLKITKKSGKEFEKTSC